MFAFRRRLTGAVATATLAAVLVACGGGDSSGGSAAGPAGEPSSGGDIVFLESGEFTSFAQQSLRLWQNSSVSVNLFEQLVFLDPETGEVEPWLATQWSVSDDLTEVELDLRDDVTFSDGTPFTPEVAIANLDRFANGDESRGITPSVPQFSAYDRAEVVDGDTIRIYLSRPDSGFLNNLSDLRHSIVAPSTLDLSLEEASDIANAIGTGPFVFDSGNKTTEITIVKRDDYDWAPGGADHSGPAYLDSITYLVSSEGSARTGQLLSNQAQAARDILISDEQTLINQGLGYHGARPFGGARTLEFALTAGEPVTDLRVRQAFQFGIDRDELIETVYNDNWARARGLVQSNTPGFVDLSDTFAFDPQRAEQLLDEAGWTERDSDGIRIKDGQRLSIRVYNEPNWVVSIPDAELISIQLARIGIDFDLQKVDAATYNAQIAKPETAFSWGHQTAADVSILWAPYRSGGTRGLNDPQFDAALDEIKLHPVGPERDAAVEAAQSYLIDNALIVPLQETQQAFVTAANLHGFRTETLGRAYFYDAWLDD